MINVALAQAVLEASRWTPFAGRGGYAPTAEQTQTRDPSVRFRQAVRERADAPAFFAFFSDPIELAGQHVLDFGCGYGGKTVAYANTAAHVSGVEPVERHIRMAREFSRDVPNVDFELCGDYDIPYPDATFDLVLSHDVLEHVKDPRASLREIWRVLKPGGRAYIVFPPYDGLYSHHLDYISTIPGLHWVFSPETLVTVVNRILSSPRGASLNTKLQPEPKSSWSGSRKVLPMLNGLTGRDFETLASEHFATELMDYRVLGHRKVSLAHRLVFALVTRPLIALGKREHVTTGISAILRK